MTKIINSAIASLVLTTISVEAGSWYVGVEQSLMNKIDNTTEIGGRSFSNDESSNITSFKIGKAEGDRGNQYEFLYNVGEKSANPTGGLKGSSLMSFGFNWNITAPTLSPTKDILPYFRIGANYVISDDKYEVYGTSDRQSYSAFGVFLGLGGQYSITDNISLSTGFDFGYRKWDTLTAGYYDIESDDKIKKFYVGAKYKF